LKDVTIVVSQAELAPFGGRAPGRRDWRGLERFAQVREDFLDRLRLRDERDQPDVASARWALQWKPLPHPRHELGPEKMLKTLKIARHVAVDERDPDAR
jgi:hypothetical protein